MKNLMALLFLLSLCSLHLVFSSIISLDHKTQCCSDTTKVRIQVEHIVKYWPTSSDCPIKAIVFKTYNKKKNHEKILCVDPAAGWVKSHMKIVDRRNKASVSQQNSQPQQ